MTDGNAAEGTVPTGTGAPAGVKGAMAEFVGDQRDEEQQRRRDGGRRGDTDARCHGARKPVLSQAIFEPAGTQVVSSLPSR